ncbi:MAG: tetratricopeptide repeat protein [Promethearchaeota archaeon]
MVAIPDLVIGFLCEFTYDLVKKIIKKESDAYSEVYDDSIEKLSKKYPKLEKTHIDIFLSQESVKKELVNYLESSSHERSFNIFKHEFFKILDKKYFSEKDAEEILKDFFEILNHVIENQPELREKFKVHTLKKIYRTTSDSSKKLENIVESQGIFGSDLKIIKEELIKNKEHEESVLKLTKKCEYMGSIPKNERFVGRSSDLKELAEVKSQVVLIEGISGIGKTSIAAEFALKNNLENNVFWYDLNEIATSKTVLCQLSSFLSQRHYSKCYDLINTGNDDLNFLTDVIISDLEKENYFLIFDNYHSIKDEQIKAIFEKFKNKLNITKLVIITRPYPEFRFYNVHDISTGKCFLKVLNGLSKEDTKEKLLSLDCKFDENSLSKIHEKTTGHPIALELFAIAVKNNSNLDALIKSLPGVIEDLIKYLFDEVFSQLSSEEQKFLKAISVYRQPVYIDGIQNISEHESVVEIALKLINKLLIEKKGDFYAIHPLIGDLSHSLISDKELFHRKAAEYLGRNQIIDPKDVIELQYHLFKAKDYSNSAWITIYLHDVLTKRGYVSPLLEILLLYKENMLPPKEWIFIGTVIGNLYIIKGDLKNAEKYFTEMLNLSRKLDYTNGISSLLNNLSGVAYNRGEIDKALEYQLESLKLYEKQNDLKGKAGVLLNLGTTYLEKTDYIKALRCVENALSEFKKNDDWVGKCGSLNLLGLIHAKTGNWDEAIRIFLEAKEVAINIEDYGYIASISGNIGNIYADRGELDKAEKEYFIDLEFSKKTEDIKKIRSVYENIGSLFADKREIEKALECHKKSLEISLKSGMLKAAASAYSHLANDYLRQNDFGNAFENCKKCIKYARKTNDSENLARALLTLAEIQREKGKKAALRLYEKSISLWKMIGDDLGKAGAYHQLGVFYFENDDCGAAAEYFNKSLLLFDKFNVTEFCSAACTNSIIVYEKLNKLDKVIEFQEKKLTYLLRSDNKENISIIYNDLILNYSKIKNWEKVIIICKKKKEIELERGDTRELAITYLTYALALRYLKKYDSAIKHYELSIDLAKHIEDDELLAVIYNDLGITHFVAGNITKSEESHLESIKIKSNVGNELGVMRSYINLAGLYIDTNRLQKGIELLEMAEDYFTTHNMMDNAILISKYILDKVMEDPKGVAELVSFDGFYETESKI